MIKYLKIRLQNCDRLAYEIITKSSFKDKKEEFRENPKWGTYTIMNRGKISVLRSLFIRKEKLDTLTLVKN